MRLTSLTCYSTCLGKAGSATGADRRKLLDAVSGLIDDLFEMQSMSMLALSEGCCGLDSWSRMDFLLALGFVTVLVLIRSEFEALVVPSVASIRERSNAALRRSIP